MTPIDILAVATGILHAAHQLATPATAWLALSLALAAFAYGAMRRWTAVALLPASMAAAMVVGLSLGRPLPMMPPPGDYTVIGARIDVDVAIYALLDDGKQLVFYRLPYSTSGANSLQAAMDGEGGAYASVGEGGGVSYDGEPPVTGDDGKQAEQPQFSLGGGS